MNTMDMNNNLAMKIFPSLSGSIRIEDKLYFWSKNINGLFKADPSGGDCRLLFQDIIGMDRGELRYSQCILCGEWIIFAPYHSSRVLFFNPFNNEFRIYKLDKPGGFCCLNKWNDWIYFWGTSIIRMKENGSFSEELKSFSESGFIGNICQIDGLIYAAGCEENRINEYNLRTGKVVHHCVGKQKHSFCTISYIDSFFWLGCKDGKIVRCSKDMLEIKEIGIPDDCFLFDQSVYQECYSNSIVFGNYIYFIPVSINSLIRVNLGTVRAEKVYEIDETELAGSVYEIDDKHIGLVIETRGSYYKVSRIIKISIDGEIQENPYFEFGDLDSYIFSSYESDIDTLQLFIKSLKS